MRYVQVVLALLSFGIAAGVQAGTVRQTNSSAPAARTRVVVEDFDEGGVGGFDPAFVHNLYFPNRDPYWLFQDATGQDPENSWLFLAPAIDDVTFDLAPGEFVDSASITVWDQCRVGCTTVEVQGSLGSLTFSNTPVQIRENFDTAGYDLGEIYLIRLRSSEGNFDNLTINVVPEPASGVMLLLVTCTLTIRKRRLSASNRRAGGGDPPGAPSSLRLLSRAWRTLEPRSIASVTRPARQQSSS